MTELYSNDGDQASIVLYLMMDRISVNLINNDKNQCEFIKISKIAPCYEEYGRNIINTMIRTGIIKGKLLREKTSLENYIVYLNDIRLTENQAVKWIKNPTINPKNGKTIVKDGPLYKRIMKKVFNIANKLDIPKRPREMISTYQEMDFLDDIEYFCKYYDLPFFKMYEKWIDNEVDDELASELLSIKVDNYITLVEFKIKNKKLMKNLMNKM